MALFSKKTKKTEEAAAPTMPAETKMKTASLGNVHSHSVLKAPRVTEKASLKSEANCFTFEVSRDATKETIAKAVTEFYKVTPTKINIVTIPAKTVTVRGRLGTKSGGKKAYVFLKKGETIEFV